MDKKILVQIKKLDDFPNDVFRQIIIEGIRTGSFVFGGYNEDSDIDILLPLKHLLIIMI